MNNRQVAHVWANRSSDRASGSNFYFEGPTIYSYGPHFPIARFADDRTVLFTIDGYSVTTSKHVRYARVALHDARVYMVTDVCADTPESHRANIANICNRANTAVRLAVKRRKAELAARDINLASKLVRDARDYATHFRVSAKRELSKLPDLSADFDAMRADIARRDAAERKADKVRRRKAERERIERERREIEEAEDYLADWRTDPTMRTVGGLYRLPVALRVKGDTVQTSHGAEVPVSHAVRMYRALKSGVNITGARIGYFTVDRVSDETIKIGCHVIPRVEIERIAELLEVA